jgi:hypothetical protein
MIEFFRLANENNWKVISIGDWCPTSVAQDDGTQETLLLIDLANHTGYAQVLEEIAAGSVIKSYLLGHDVIAQADNISAPAHHLFDGHGSTRAMIDASGAIVTPTTGPGAGVLQLYAYSACGQALGFVESHAITALLYSGEWFDAAIGMQYLRARYYDAARTQSSTRHTSGATADAEMLRSTDRYGAVEPTVNMVRHLAKRLVEGLLPIDRSWVALPSCVPLASPVQANCVRFALHYDETTESRFANDLRCRPCFR